MIHKTKFLAALALVVVSASFAQAATASLSYSVTTRFSDDGNFEMLPFTWAPGEAIDDGPGIYQLDLSINVTDLGAGERGLGAFSWDSIFGAGTSADPAAPYGPDTSTVDSNGAAPGGVVPKWATNTDGGVPGDYQGILVAGAAGQLNNAVDPRATLGSPDPEFFGTAFIKWDGSVENSSWTISNFQYSIANPEGIFGGPVVGPNMVVNFLGEDGGDDPVVGDLNLSTSFFEETLAGVVPLTDVDELDFDNIAAPGFVPLIDGKPLTLGFLPTLDDNGNFSWNTAGSLRGTYTWSITGTNSTGSDTGLITVVVQHVPEPATMTLFGLALVGMVGLARRRS